MEAYGKYDNMNSNLIGDPGRFLPSLPKNRGRDRNNDRHRDPEHVKDTKRGEKLETCKGKEITCLETHPHNMRGHSIRGTLQLEGTRGTYNVWT